jgi:hypothetical protein
MVPALLAEMILRAVAARGVTLVVAARAPADVVILGPGAAPGRAAGAPVLALSEDFSRLLGPGPEDDVAFTADALAGRLREIAESI